MMKKILKNKGFTMIELLIVIAVLGVLAVAVLSAINPIEQINRGRDTGSRSDAEQILSAIDRYYTSQQYYPWQTAPDPMGNDGIDWTALKDATDGTDFVLNKLAASGTEEIKQSFVNRLQDARYQLYLYKADGSENSVYVCFIPRSGSFKTEAADRCAAKSGPLPSDYPVSEACNNTTNCGTGGNCICLP